MRIRTAMVLAILLALTAVNVDSLRAQSGTSSALTGTHQRCDRSGCSQCHGEGYGREHGATRTARSNGDGRFLFAQVNPGTYRIAVQADGFGPAESQPAAVAVGQTIAVNFTLKPAATSQTVEVTTQNGLLSLENPNTSTTLEAKAIEKLPNPGQDLTYLAQFAQGALMNTAGSSNDAKAAGGYGNVEFNGLPATSNGYILDGYDTNDPWLGLNIGLSTNLVIGLDAVQEATVNTNSFSVDQGRYAVAQVNYFTKSGTNAFHGDAYEIWNGSLFNAEDYFLHANDTADSVAKKPRSTVNEFGVSVGGPIRKRQAIFLRALRGHSHRTAARIADYPANAGLPAICIGATGDGRNGPGHGRGSSGAACRDPLLSERCSPCCPRPAAHRCRLSDARLVQTAMAARASARLR